MQRANRHFPSLEMLLVLHPPGYDRLTFGRDLYHGGLLLAPNLLLLLSVAKEAGFSHSQLLQSVMSEICGLGFIPEDFYALHKVQLWGWHGSAPEARTTGGRVGQWMLCMAVLGLFVPWREAAATKIVCSVLTMTKPLLKVMSERGRRRGKCLQGVWSNGHCPKERGRLGCHTHHR